MVSSTNLLFPPFLFVRCPVLPQVGYLSLIVLGANKKSRCRCLHFIPHIHTPKKMASFTATVRIYVRFLQYTREMYLARFAFVYARARADVFFFLSVAGKFATHVGIIIPLTRVAKINRVSRNHREDRRRETDVQNNFFSSQQTTQLTQFSAVSSQFKNRTVAKVRAFRTI